MFSATSSPELPFFIVNGLSQLPDSLQSSSRSSVENLLEISLQAADTLSSQKGRMARRMIDEDFADQPSVNYFCIDSQIVASLPRKKKEP